jgi:hypothetical protein
MQSTGDGVFALFRDALRARGSFANELCTLPEGRKRTKRYADKLRERGQPIKWNVLWAFPSGLVVKSPT